MEEKFVRLDFDSAKIVTFCKEKGKPTRNVEASELVETPVRWNNISNMLHVLLGLRPSPVNRKSIATRLDVIDEIAKNALVRINTKYYCVERCKNGEFLKLFQEFTQGKGGKEGMAWNSNRKGVKAISSAGNVYEGGVTWRTVELYYAYKRETYDFFVETIEKQLPGARVKYTLIDALETIFKDDSATDAILHEFEKEGSGIPKSVVDFIKTRGESYKPYMTQNNRGHLSALTTNTKEVYKVSLSGSILVKLPMNLFMELHNGKRCATLLDGGCVLYDGRYMDNVNVDEKIACGYRKVYNN